MKTTIEADIIYKLAIALLNDDHGITDSAWGLLWPLLQRCGRDKTLKIDDLFSRIKQNEGRVYLPINFWKLEPNDPRLNSQPHPSVAKVVCPNCGNTDVAAAFEINPVSGCHCCPQCGYEGTDDQQNWNANFQDEGVVQIKQIHTCSICDATLMSGNCPNCDAPVT